MKRDAASPACSRGFTLIEMAIVLMISGIMLGGLLLPLSAQMDAQAYRDTNNRLEEIKETLLGFAMAQGRLPCPASSTSNGLEDPPGGGNCNHDYDGFLPAVSLGLANVDGSGYALDGWGAIPANRIRYAVSRDHNHAFTTVNGMLATGMATLAPNLHVCASASGINTSSCGTASSLTTSAVAVIFSAGKNAATGGSGQDESKNYDNNPVFVSHVPAPTAAANGEFDDIVTWISPNLLYSRMVVAGQLP